MSETTSSSFWQSRLSSATAAGVLLFASCSSSLPMHVIVSDLAIVKDGIKTDLTASRSEHLPGENGFRSTTRAMRINALRGKYKTVLTPSEEFARQKLSEITIEG
jgi:hypothetical protein